jgi:alpha-beta hydrolase superfamily lysophospholipase
MAGVRPDLPLYIAAGDQDPVNGQLALVNALVGRYRAASLTDVELHIYRGARHEILNETNRDEVEADLLSWLDRIAPRG